MRKVSAIAAVIAIMMAAGCTQDQNQKLNSQAAKEYQKPIRPAAEGRNPCWNEFCKKFIYAPAFDVAAVDGASSYLFKLSSDAGEWSFTAKEPTADLSPVWADVTPSKVELNVLALDAKGEVLDTAYTRSFIRDFPFQAPYNGNVRPYREAAVMAALYIHQSKSTQAWKTSTVPDMSYSHYTYANKIVGGLITVESIVAREVPALREEALLIARNAAQFLIDQSRPEGDALEFFPPTYYLDLVASSKPWNIGKMMTMDACMAGNAFLDLYDATGDSLYFDRAVKIANTYLKLQREDGSFPIKVDYATGEPVNEVGAMLHPILNYIRRLENSYGVEGLSGMRDKSQAWMTAVALETFDLTGQFEDVNVEGLKPYQNLTNCTAAPYASYILKGNPDAKALEDARDLLRLSEDQFVHWDALPNANGVRPICTPCVYEQHKYQVPVDNSSCNVANAYLDLYLLTGDELAFAKAKALIDNITIMQEPTSGRIPTTWDLRSTEKDKRRSFWINCSKASIQILLRMAEITGETRSE